MKKDRSSRAASHDADDDQASLVIVHYQELDIMRKNYHCTAHSSNFQVGLKGIFSISWLLVKIKMRETEKNGERRSKNLPGKIRINVQLLHDRYIFPPSPNLA